MKKLISYILVIVFFITYTLPSENVEAKSSRSYTGEQLFEGIYFGYGEIGRKFPEIWEKNEHKNLIYNKEFLEDIKDIKNQLKKNDSNYFKKFKEKVTGGNQINIEEQLNKTNNDIIQIVRNYQNIEESIGPRGLKPGFVVAAVYSYVGATHILVAAALSFVVVGTRVYIKTKGRSADNVMIDEGLSQEQYINLIAERLS
ncbi:hypothetical protein ABLV89_05745 [Staphylococcus equorum]